MKCYTIVTLPGPQLACTQVKHTITYGKKPGVGVHTFSAVGNRPDVPCQEDCPIESAPLFTVDGPPRHSLPFAEIIDVDAWL